MTLNRIKLGRAVTFMTYLASVVSLLFLPKTLVWNKITFLASNLLNLAESQKFQQKLPIFLSLFNLSLRNVKISRAYN